MKKILVIAMCLGLAGCATAGSCLNKGNIAKLERGITTQEEVLKIFGPPDSMSFNEDGEAIFSYSDIQARNSAWNYIPVFSFIHSEMKLTNQILTVTFKGNVVDDYTFTSTKLPQKIPCGLLS